MQEKQNSTGLVWFTNNLRVQDNIVLSQALQNHDTIIAIYCFDPRHYQLNSYGFKKTEKFRAQFLIETIHNLKYNLNLLHVELFVFFEQPENLLPKLVTTYGINKIYVQNEWTQEEQHVFELAKKEVPTVEFHVYFDQFLYHPNDINLNASEIPQVFTNFRKHVEKSCMIRNEIDINHTQEKKPILNKSEIPSLQDLGFSKFNTHFHSAFPFKGGETSALNRLNDYFFSTKKLGVYKKTRNGLLGTDYSSKFSPWLANGSISARTIYWNIKKYEKEHETNSSTYWLVFELIWRDYFKYMSLKWGNDIFKIGGILQKKYEWNYDIVLLELWIHGKTASPFVNANMLELKKTGWMSNRGRQNVAS